MVIAFHFKVKYLGISGGRGRNESGIKEFENSIADIREFALDFGSVVTDHRDMVIITSALLLLLDGGNNTPRGPTSADDVLVGDGEEVSLLDGELLLVNRSGNLLHELDHLLVALGLLSKLGHVNILLAKRGGGSHCKEMEIGSEDRWIWDQRVKEGEEEEEREEERKTESGGGGLLRAECKAFFRSSGPKITAEMERDFSDSISALRSLKFVCIFL